MNPLATKEMKAFKNWVTLGKEREAKFFIFVELLSNRSFLKELPVGLVLFHLLQL